MIRHVKLKDNLLKQLDKIPEYVVIKLQAWIDNVEHEGLDIVRRIPGFHDEPLHGRRSGQRSIRLSRAYRAIYVVKSDLVGKYVLVQEVNKHDY